MSSQIPDIVHYVHHQYEPVGIDGHGLFDPADHGIETMPMHTACYRGFICTYAVARRRLHLRSLNINAASRLPALFGVNPPHPDDDFIRGKPTYEFRSAPVAFTGGLLIARDFQQELYVHMGFHPGWKYRTVHELRFANGRLVTATDRSGEMAAERDAHLGGPSQKPRDLVREIDESFSRRYER